MATSVKKRIRRRPSWLSPMWRDIDSLRRQNALSRQQNEELRKENEAIARETKQIDQEIEIIDQEIEQIDLEIEQIDRETEQIEQETEQIEQETAILRRQNKALAFLESRDFDKMIKELAGPADGDARHPLDRVDVCLLCEKLVEHGCDERDLPFLLKALDLEIPHGSSQTSNSSSFQQTLPISTVKQQPREATGNLWLADHNKQLAEYLVQRFAGGLNFLDSMALYIKLIENPELARSIVQQGQRDPKGAFRNIVQLVSKQDLVVADNQLKDNAFGLREDVAVIQPND